MRMMIAVFLSTISLGAALPLASASATGLSSGSVELAQAQPNSTNRNIPAEGQGVRPPRYVCIIKPPASDKQSGQYSCRRSSGRVGESCRCPNTVGTGKLMQY
ncbi:hypothetical protein [Allorhizobium undicola]|uniref:hypothetical protein n=1 Tax=Allorhizobium undicola TaxID=78527 RepID=UPI0012B547FB|nr:hypothetical protein [Allorhizobium undicola]